LKTILTLDIQLPDIATCSVMKVEPPIALKKMDVELTGEITFGI
jgi:hypothetical protein